MWYVAAVIAANPLIYICVFFILLSMYQSFSLLLISFCDDVLNILTDSVISCLCHHLSSDAILRMMIFEIASDSLYTHPSDITIFRNIPFKTGCHPDWYLFYHSMGVSINRGTPIAGWFLLGKLPLKMDDLRVPL